jgi:hypothetical protein
VFEQHIFETDKFLSFLTDNAGFELYCDFVYADWLIQSGICDQIVFHGKKLPWFVSDVTRKDWDWYVARFGADKDPPLIGCSP